MRTLRLTALAATLAVTALAAAPGAARAQIKQPGAHPHYNSEIEPHLFIQWDNAGWWDDEGFGLGLRVTIPLVHNGPIETINNNMGIGFGFDWAHFDDACFIGDAGPGWVRGWNCGGGSMNDFWLPIVWQWSFFFSDLISAFFEPGLAIEHTRWSDAWCAGNVCDSDETETGLEFVMWLGVRFHLSDDVALVLRLGTPSLNFGPAFFM